MILVTGAAGKTGWAVLEFLLDRRAPARALVRSQSKAEALRGLGPVEIVIGDMRSPEDVRRAALGVKAIYHIPPNVHPEEVAIGRAAIAAGVQAGIERFVYHSVLHPQIEAMPHHWLKMRVEALLFESGLPFTILQPAPYFQNVLPYLARIREEGGYSVPYSAEAGLAHVDLADLAEAAAIVLTEPGHAHAVYEICGEPALTPADIANKAGDWLRREVRSKALPVAAWAEQARSDGLGEYAVETLSAMFRYYDAFGLRGNTNVLANLLGRSPRSFRAFLEPLEIRS